MRLWKLDKTAERLVRELKEANSEKKKLLKELAAKESGALAESAAETEDVAGVTLVKRDFGCRRGREPHGADRERNPQTQPNHRYAVLWCGREER
jgi:hypothetical protein